MVGTGRIIHIIIPIPVGVITTTIPITVTGMTMVITGATTGQLTAQVITQEEVIVMTGTTTAVYPTGQLTGTPQGLPAVPGAEKPMPPETIPGTDPGTMQPELL